MIVISPIKVRICQQSNMNFAYFYGFLHQIYFDFTSSHMGYGPLILVCGDRHVASAENPRDGPEDVPSEAFRGHPAVGPGDSLLEVASREQQVLMRSRPSKLRLQSSHAQNVDVAMQRRRNLSLATHVLGSFTLSLTCRT